MQRKKLIAIGIAIALQTYYNPAMAADQNDEDKECSANISLLSKAERDKLPATCLAALAEKDNYWSWAIGGIAALAAGVAIGIENNGGGDSYHHNTPDDVIPPDDGGNTPDDGGNTPTPPDTTVTQYHNDVTVDHGAQTVDINTLTVRGNDLGDVTFGYQLSDTGDAATLTATTPYSAARRIKGYSGSATAAAILSLPATIRRLSRAMVPNIPVRAGWISAATAQPTPYPATRWWTVPREWLFPVITPLPA